MEVNSSASIVAQEIGRNKGQVGLEVLTRTLAQGGATAKVESPQDEAIRSDISKQTGKGQNIDIKV